ncbi:MAG: prolipoprotein diacylglyceryl transferase family protein [bacterium]
MFPLLGYIGNFYISSYLVLNVLGIIAGLCLLSFHLTSFKKGKANKILIFAFLIFIPFFIGARAGFIVEQLFIGQLPVFNFFGAVSLWWGLVAAVLFAFPIAALLKVNIWETADLFSVSIALGGVFARLACLLNGCCIGLPTSKEFPLAAFFSSSSYAYSVFGDTPLLPTQLFEALAWLAIFILLMTYKPRKKYHGELIILMGLSYSLSRFIIEFFRYHEAPQQFLIVDIFCAVIFIFSAFLWLNKKYLLSKA